jgi:GTP-binding protein
MRWKGPVFQISALAREGLDPLIQSVYQHVASVRDAAPPEIDVRFATE